MKKFLIGLLAVFGVFAAEYIPPPFTSGTLTNISMTNGFAFEVNTWADLKALTIPANSGRMTALVKGRVSTNDGGGGTFFFTPGAGATDDGGTIATPNVGSGGWFRLYSSALNVRWFGAVGDGVANDYMAINNTITAAIASPFRAVFVPVGTYAIGSQLLLTPANFTMRGENSGKTTIKYTGVANIDAVVKWSSGSALYNVGMENLTISGNSHSGAALKGFKLFHFNFTNLRLRDVAVTGFYGDFCESGVMVNCTTSSNEGAWVTTPVNGIILTNNANDILIQSPSVEGVSGDGIILDNLCLGNVIVGGTSEGNGGGIHLKSTCANNTVQGLYLEADGADIVVDATSNDNRFEGSIAGASGSIQLSGNRNTVIGGNWGAITIFANAVGNRLLFLTYSDDGGNLTDNGTATEYYQIYNLSTATFQRDKINQYQVNQSTLITDPTLAAQYVALYLSGTTNNFGIGLSNTNAYLRSFAGYGMNLQSAAGLSLKATLPNAITLTGGDGGTGSSIAQFLDFSGTLTASIRGDGALVVPNGKTVLNTSALTWPGSVGAANTFLTDVAGNGTLSWATVSSAPASTLVGPLTATAIPYASGTTNLANSPISRLSATDVGPTTDNGSTLGDTTHRWSGIFAMPLNASSNTLSLYDSSGTIASVFGPAGGLTLGGQVPPGAGNLQLSGTVRPITDATGTVGTAPLRWGGMFSTIYTANAGSISSDTPNVVSQQWNAGGVIFHGFVVAFTNTASSSGSEPFSITNATTGHELFTVVQDGRIAQFAKTITYNNISTVSGGIPAEYATVDLTAQTAAITATTLYTPAASGMFRISFVIRVTTAASVSSILGGTTGIVLTFTEPDGSVAQTFVLATDDQTGAVVIPANGNTANTTQAMNQGTAVIYAKTGVAIQYAVGYSSTGTAMQYSVHAKCESL